MYKRDYKKSLPRKKGTGNCKPVMNLDLRGGLDHTVTLKSGASKWEVHYC